MKLDSVLVGGTEAMVDPAKVAVDSAIASSGVGAMPLGGKGVADAERCNGCLEYQLVEHQ